LTDSKSIPKCEPKPKIDSAQCICVSNPPPTDDANTGHILRRSRWATQNCAPLHRDAFVQRWARDRVRPALPGSAAALAVSARRACDGARRLGARRSELGGDLLGRRGKAASRRGGSMAVGARPRDDLPGEAECARRGEASPRWPAVRRARGGRGSGSGCEIWRRSAGRRCGARGGRKRATGRKGTGGWILYFCVACWRRKYLGT